MNDRESENDQMYIFNIYRNDITAHQIVIVFL